MTLKVVTAPTVYPVTIAEVEAHLRADLFDDTALVNLYIGAVASKAEAYLKRSLCPQTLEYYLDKFPVGKTIALPASPVTSVTSVKYYDSNSTLQTLPSAEYTLLSDSRTISLKYGYVWPVTLPHPESVVIKYDAGYTSVPEPVKAWLLMNVGTLYENRETVTIGAGSVLSLNTIADSLLDSMVAW